MTNNEQVNLAAYMAIEEVYRARKIHPERFNSLHEGYAILLEEVNELWDEVRKKESDPAHLRHEAVQVAAMALRFISELTMEL
jgi:GH15 family glucan-1,4-alpha-glucosidase